MAKKQTRRAVSLRGESYRKVSTYCEVKGISRSAFVEELVDAFFKQREPSFARPTSEPPAKKTPVRGGGVHSL